MKKYLVALTAVSFLFACKQSSRQQQPAAQKVDGAIDTVVIVDDPKSNQNVQTDQFYEIDSSGIIMFPLPIGDDSRRSSGRSSKNMPFGFWNIVFYNGKTGARYLLTDKKIWIRRYDVTSVNDEAHLIPENKNIFYLATADDMNGDKTLTDDDPQYLFASDKEGRNFRQVSPTGYDLKSFLYIKSINKLILTAAKDSDGNKIYDNEDEIIAFEVDVNNNAQAAKEIFSKEFKNSLKQTFNKHWK